MRWLQNNTFLFFNCGDSEFHFSLVDEKFHLCMCQELLNTEFDKNPHIIIFTIIIFTIIIIIIIIITTITYNHNYYFNIITILLL
jgi:hypothetical protein